MADEFAGVAESVNEIANSSALEHVLEHIFLSELLQEAWFLRGRVVDVLHTSVDAFGYDVALEMNGIVRHVQLKGRRKTGKTSSYKISQLLGERKSGCVVVMLWERNPETDRIDMAYRWFGGAPGEQLPNLGDKIAKHSKGDASGNKNERNAIRVVGLGSFDKPCGIGDLLDKLFGPAAVKVYSTVGAEAVAGQPSNRRRRRECAPSAPVVSDG